MALKTDIRGMVWKYPDTFVVGREQVRQYAKAVKADDPATHRRGRRRRTRPRALVAPLTFVSIFAVMIQKHFFQHVDVGMETMQIVQVDQKFLFHQPIKAGDELTRHHVRRVGRRAVRRRHRHHPQRAAPTQDGEVVMEAFTTLMGHEGDNSISVKWDPETGQVVRTAAAE